MTRIRKNVPVKFIAELKTFQESPLKAKRRVKIVVYRIIKKFYESHNSFLMALYFDDLNLLFPHGCVIHV